VSGGSLAHVKRSRTKKLAEGGGFRERGGAALLRKNRATRIQLRKRMQSEGYQKGRVARAPGKGEKDTIGYPPEEKRGRLVDLGEISRNSKVSPHPSGERGQGSTRRNRAGKDSLVDHRRGRRG